MRRQGKLPRRSALHDARSVGAAERADVRLSFLGEPGRSRRAPGRQACRRAARLARRGEERGAQARGPGSGLSMKFPIYLDYSATTPVDPRVAEKMIPFLTEQFGNPASRSHAFGWRTEEAVEDARAQVGALVNCEGKDIVWTSGATESINLALKGAAEFYKTKGKHLITVKTEH